MSLNIAIIGAGSLGLKRFEIFKDINHINELYFYDPNVKKIQSYRSEVDLDSIFLNKNIHAIVICTPNAPKMELIEKCFKFNKHIFCEKPLIVSENEKLKLKSLTRENPKIKVKFGFNHRYLSHYKELKSILKSEKFGKPVWVRGVYGKGLSDSFFENWRADRSISGGGILFDQGIHMLDLIIDIFGDLNVINALIDDFEKYPGIESNAFINLRSLDGVPISIHSSMYQWKHRFSLEVGTESAIVGIEGLVSSTKSYGSEESFIYSNWKNNFPEENKKKHVKPSFYSFVDESNDFIDSIINNCPTSNGTVNDTLKVMDLIDNIYSSRQ
jgi:predicted dehydrogenase